MLSSTKPHPGLSDCPGPEVQLTLAFHRARDHGIVSDSGQTVEP
jgi:hypothetical protein